MHVEHGMEEPVVHHKRERERMSEISPLPLRPPKPFKNPGSGRDRAVSIPAVRLTEEVPFEVPARTTRSQSHSELEPIQEAAPVVTTFETEPVLCNGVCCGARNATAIAFWSDVALVIYVFFRSSIVYLELRSEGSMLDFVGDLLIIVLPGIGCLWKLWQGLNLQEQSYLIPYLLWKVVVISRLFIAFIVSCVRISDSEKQHEHTVSMVTMWLIFSYVIHATLSVYFFYAVHQFRKYLKRQQVWAKVSVNQQHLQPPGYQNYQSADGY